METLIERLHALHNMLLNSQAPTNEELDQIIEAAEYIKTLEEILTRYEAQT